MHFEVAQIQPNEIGNLLNKPGFAWDILNLGLRMTGDHKLAIELLSQVVEDLGRPGIVPVKKLAAINTIYQSARGISRGIFYINDETLVNEHRVQIGSVPFVTMVNKNAGFESSPSQIYSSLNAPVLSRQAVPTSDVLMLRHIVGLNGDETAHVLGIESNYVKQIVSRGMKALIKSL